MTYSTSFYTFATIAEVQAEWDRLVDVAIVKVQERISDESTRPSQLSAEFAKGDYALLSSLFSQRDELAVILHKAALVAQLQANVAAYDAIVSGETPSPFTANTEPTVGAGIGIYQKECGNWFLHSDEWTSLDLVELRIQPKEGFSTLAEAKAEAERSDQWFTFSFAYPSNYPA